MEKTNRTKYVLALVALATAAVVGGLLWTGKPPSPASQDVEQRRNETDPWRHLQQASDRASTAVIPGPSSELVAAPVILQPKSEAAIAQELRAGATKVLLLERMIPHQVGIRDISCKERICNIALQLPPFVDASVRRDNKVAADLMDELRIELGKQGAQVALSQLEHTREGMAVSIQVEAAPDKGRYLTDYEIAKIRAETIQDYLKSQKK
jgi:hypothetical protein